MSLDEDSPKTNDLECHNLTLTEAVNMAQNRPLRRLLLCTRVMQARNDDDDDDDVKSW